MADGTLLLKIKIYLSLSIRESKSPRESSFPPLKSENTNATSGLDKVNLLYVTFTNHYNRSVPELSISDLPEVVLTDCR